MDRDEALKQLDVINQAIGASHKFLMSGPLAIAYGLAILLFPVIEISTKRMTFGTNLPVALVGILHVVVYLSIFQALKLIVENIWKDDVTNPSHPLLIQALSFHKPVVVSICGAIFILIYAGQIDLAGPIVFMMMGILFNIYGRITSPFVLWVSRSYIALGILFGVLVSKDKPYLWVWFNSYLGLSFIVMGLHLRQEKEKSWTNS
jgi:hypothetical protein